MIKKINIALRELNIKDKPIVVYSAMFPFVRAIQKDPQCFCDDLIEVLINNSATLFMPTFTDGFKNGSCNLDLEKSTTGTLTEIFRQKKEVKRTLSAFFSFGVIGKSQKEIISLKPKHAWGKGSLYEWFEQNDAQIITIGTHPTHCSFTHRVEWLCKDVIKYRHNKEFEGTIIRDGEKIPLKETLYVRNLSPSPKNDWKWAINDFVKAGMKIIDIDGIKISCINAKTKINLLVPMVRKDPLILITNKDDFKSFY